MKKTKRNRKALALSAAMAALLLSPMTMNAQYNENKYGIQPWFGTSLMGREGLRGDDDGGLDLQNFGENQDGLSLQNFGENAPLGSGWLVLTISGLGYAAMKTRKSKKQTKSIK